MKNLFEPVEIIRQPENILVREHGQEIARVPVNAPLIARYIDGDYCVRATDATDSQIFAAVKVIPILGVSHEPENI